jgi:hypothetical protein
LRFGEQPLRSNDTLKEILYFLYADIARLIAPTSSEHEQLTQTAWALYSNNVTIPPAYYQTLQIFNPTGWGTPGRHFFDMSVAQRVSASLSPLLDLILNAAPDLNEITRIVNRTRPEELPILLSTPGLATIEHLRYPRIQRTGTQLQMALYGGDKDVVDYLKTEMDPAEFERQSKEVFNNGLRLEIRHLNIQRIGTLLQMALYGGDEDVVDYLKRVMDPAEFERQSKDVFRNALPREIRTKLDAKDAPAAEYYNALLSVQKEAAEKLCNEEFAFDALTNRFPINAATVAEFQKKLEDYVRNNPIHNPFILCRLYEIYEEAPSVSYDNDSLFSAKAIGAAQAQSSARWLQHYAQGITKLSGYGIHTPQRPLRSFKCRGGASWGYDVRSFIHEKCWGVRSFLTSFEGWHNIGGREERFGRRYECNTRFATASCLKFFVEQKHSAFRQIYAASALYTAPVCSAVT